MMNDDLYERLNDYFDGVLPEAERRAFEAALATDAELRAEVAALRALRAEASALPRAIAPERDLWQGIQARLERAPAEEAENTVSFRRRAGAPRRVSTWSYLVAAAAMLLVMTGAAIVLNRTPATTGPTTAAADPSSLPDDAEFKRVAAQYVEARKELVDLLEERRGNIAPETLAVVEENLTVIASAVSEIEVALAKEPQSRKLKRMLYTAYRSEVDLLQHAVQLADESAASNQADETKGDGDDV